MRLHVDRPCRVWRDGDAWTWRCCVCTYCQLPFTGTAATWRHAFGDADDHIRSEHQPSRLAA